MFSFKKITIPLYVRQMLEYLVTEYLSLYNKCSSLQTNLDNHGSSIQTLQGQVESLQSQVESLQSQVQTLQSQMADVINAVNNTGNNNSETT